MHYPFQILWHEGKCFLAPVGRPKHLCLVSIHSSEAGLVERCFFALSMILVAPFWQTLHAVEPAGAALCEKVSQESKATVPTHLETIKQLVFQRSFSKRVAEVVTTDWSASTYTR